MSFCAFSTAGSRAGDEKTAGHKGPDRDPGRPLWLLGVEQEDICARVEVVVGHDKLSGKLPHAAGKQEPASGNEHGHAMGESPRCLRKIKIHRRFAAVKGGIIADAGKVDTPGQVVTLYPGMATGAVRLESGIPEDGITGRAFHRKRRFKFQKGEFLAGDFQNRRLVAFSIKYGNQIGIVCYFELFLRNGVVENGGPQLEDRDVERSGMQSVHSGPQGIPVGCHPAEQKDVIPGTAEQIRERPSGLKILYSPEAFARCVDFHAARTVPVAGNHHPAVCKRQGRCLGALAAHDAKGRKTVCARIVYLSAPALADAESLSIAAGEEQLSVLEQRDGTAVMRPCHGNGVPGASIEILCSLNGLEAGGMPAENGRFSVKQYGAVVSPWRLKGRQLLKGHLVEKMVLGACANDTKPCKEKYELLFHQWFTNKCTLGNDSTLPRFK